MSKGKIAVLLGAAFVGLMVLFYWLGGEKAPVEITQSIAVPQAAGEE